MNSTEMVNLADSLYHIIYNYFLSFLLHLIYIYELEQSKQFTEKTDSIYSADCFQNKTTIFADIKDALQV